jgi:CRISPR-associated protein Csb1
MTVDLNALKDQPRLLFEIPLEPLQGQRFQPTGFPNLGAATFTSKDGACLLVESAQSMANRFEATIWNEGTNQLIPECAGLSYVEVKDATGKFLTASPLEAHRLNSVYIEAADAGAFHQGFAQESGYDEKKPIDRSAFLTALLKYDVNSLLHGTFLESIGGRLRVARALSSFIEAKGVQVAPSGGVKNDRIMPGKEGEKTASEGYGNVPFSRDEFTANEITMFVNLDLAQIRGYGLGDEVERLLVLLALLKLRLLVDGDLRLRTACDLSPVGKKVPPSTSPSGWSLPEATVLKTDVKAAIAACKGKMVGAPATSVTYSGAKKKPVKAQEDGHQRGDDNNNEDGGDGDNA